jgi:hypothetical protein
LILYLSAKERRLPHVKSAFLCPRASIGLAVDQALALSDPRKFIETTPGPFTRMLHDTCSYPV